MFRILEKFCILVNSLNIKPAIVNQIIKKQYKIFLSNEAEKHIDKYYYYPAFLCARM
jgi:hypothetical protein